LKQPFAAIISFVNDHSFRICIFQNYTLNDDQPGFV